MLKTYGVGKGGGAGDGGEGAGCSQMKDWSRRLMLFQGEISAVRGVERASSSPLYCSTLFCCIFSEKQKVSGAARRLTSEQSATLHLLPAEAHLGSNIFQSISLCRCCSFTAHHFTLNFPFLSLIIFSPALHQLWLLLKLFRQLWNFVISVSVVTHRDHEPGDWWSSAVLIFTYLFHLCCCC